MGNGGVGNGHGDSKAKFKKAQYKDYLDPTSVKVIQKRWKDLSFDSSGKIHFQAKIVSSKLNLETNVESYLVEWQPRNM